MKNEKRPFDLGDPFVIEAEIKFDQKGVADWFSQGKEAVIVKVEDITEHKYYTIRTKIGYKWWERILMVFGYRPKKIRVRKFDKRGGL